LKFHFPFHTEPEATSACLGAAPSIQTHPTGSLPDSGEGGLNVSLNHRPLGDIEDEYASDPEDPVQPSDIVCPQPVQGLQAILQDEDRRDYEHDDIPNQPSVDTVCNDNGSVDSVIPPSSASLSPGTKLNEIHASMKILMKECKARDYLASNNEHKDRELVDERHKRKSQEGKTAAHWQTRKVNLADQGKMKAMEGKSAAEAETERQKQLREKTEADKSILMIANAGFSTAMVNFSAASGDKVCCGLFVRLLYPLTITTIADRSLASEKWFCVPQGIYLPSERTQTHPGGTRQSPQLEGCGTCSPVFRCCLSALL